MRSFSSVIFVLALSILFTPTQSYGQPETSDKPSTEDLPIVKANPSLDKKLLNNLPEVVQQSTVFIDSDVNSDSVIFYPDGTLVPGQSADKVARAKEIQKRGGCGNTSFLAYPFAFRISLGNCAVFGYKGYSRHYSWWAAPGVDGSVAVQGGGFRCANYVEQPLPGSDCGPSGYVQKWVGFGAANSGSGYAYWGNVLATPKIRSKSIVYPYSGAWR